MAFPRTHARTHARDDLICGANVRLALQPLSISLSFFLWVRFIEDVSRRAVGGNFR